MTDAALGCSVGTGWAVGVALILAAEPDRRPPPGLEVVDRRRVELASDPERFVYHAAAERPVDEARALVDAVAARAVRAAAAAVADITGALAAAGHRLTCAAVVGPADEPPDPPLDRVLASHAAIHTAEGRLYRSAVRQACEEAGMAVLGVRRKELADRVATAAGVDGPQVASAVTALGRVLGPPWRREHKEAALAAWLALLSA